MTDRTALVLLATALAVSPGPAADNPPDLPSGKVVPGELAGEKKATPWLGFVDSYYGYMTELSVTLKAGDAIRILGEVAGTDRRVAIALIDPSGEMIAATNRDKDVGRTGLLVRQVNADGRYTVRVVSNLTGAFIIKAEYPPGKNKPEVETEASLKADIARLEKELADKKARLAALRTPKK